MEFKSQPKGECKETRRGQSGKPKRRLTMRQFTRRMKTEQNRSTFNSGPQNDGQQEPPPCTIWRLISGVYESLLPNILHLISTTVSDFRRAPIYTTSEIILGCVHLFLLRSTSRNHHNNLMDHNCKSAIGSFLGLGVPHQDTINRVLRRVDPRELEELLAHMVKELIKKKKFAPLKIRDRYIVGVDGTGVGSTEQEEGTTYTVSSGGIITNVKKVVSFKLLGENNIAISLYAEWIANSNEQGENEPQDCEIKAAERGLRELRRLYPQLPITILGDGLYATQNFIDLCKELDFEYCITLRKKQSPRLWQLIEDRIVSAVEGSEESQGFFTADTPPEVFDSEITWASDLNHKKSVVHWVSQTEQREPDEEKTFAYITSLHIDSDEDAAETVAIGRLRIVIEDSFNTQKNRGFNLQHKYSRVSHRATQNYCILLEIAHTISQLIEATPQFIDAKESRPGHSTLKSIWESTRNYFSCETIEIIMMKIAEVKKKCIKKFVLLL